MGQDKFDSTNQLFAVAKVMQWLPKPQTSKSPLSVQIRFSQHLFKRLGLGDHVHGLVLELKERMNSRQDRPVKNWDVVCQRSLSLTTNYRRGLD